LHTITDSEGQSDNCEPIVVTIEEGQAPACSFDFAPTDPDIGQTVSFVDTSDDPDGTIEDSDWDFGDGNTGSGTSVSHIYTSPASFIVQHTVTDDQGLSSSCTATVNVAFVGTAPTCNFTFSQTSALTITFNASSSADTDENGQSITTYEWAFGDGQTATLGSPGISHTYSSANTYVVNLAVTDDEGDETACTPQNVPVNP
jgi:PKD repeat protein